MRARHLTYTYACVLAASDGHHGASQPGERDAFIGVLQDYMDVILDAPARQQATDEVCACTNHTVPLTFHTHIPMVHPECPMCAVVGQHDSPQDVYVHLISKAWLRAQVQTHT
jgi:hypothetical protein